MLYVLHKNPVLEFINLLQLKPLSADKYFSNSESKKSPSGCEINVMAFLKINPPVGGSIFL
jgi:hypothetical protein